MATTSEIAQGLEAAFDLSEEACPDEDLRGLYESLIRKMLAEAEHLRMNTVQTLLIERIAYNYVVLKRNERKRTGGFKDSQAQKDFNTFWLSMTKEFSANLRADKKAPSEAMVLQIEQAVLAAAGTLPIESVDRQKFAVALREQFELVGL
jgi:hypothetical protein